MQDFPNHSHGGTDPGPRDVIRDRENADVHVSWAGFAVAAALCPHIVVICSPIHRACASIDGSYRIHGELVFHIELFLRFIGTRSSQARSWPPSLNRQQSRSGGRVNPLLRTELGGSIASLSCVQEQPTIDVLVMTYNHRRAIPYFHGAVQQHLSSVLVWLGDAVAFLTRTAWPLIDLLIRIWIGKLALVSSVLISTDWGMAVGMAAGSYPIPVEGLGSTALMSQVYWLAAVSLILGLATRVGAAVLLALAVASHIRVAALDLNLFWMALLACYVLLGADRLSLDRLLSQGLKSGPLPKVGALITLLDAARPALTGMYLLALRVALMLTLLLAGGHMSTAMMTATAGIQAWLPANSATLLFGNEGVALALLIGIGLATRATALLTVLMIGYHKMSGGDVSFPFYWTGAPVALGRQGSWTVLARRRRTRRVAAEFGRAVGQASF
jgi:hypothetical protein